MESTVRWQPQPLVRGDELDDTFRLAKALASSGRFPNARNAEQALAVILLGRDLGLSATQSLTGIHVVEGKPQLAAVTLGAFVKQAPGYDYKVLALTDEKCAIEFSFEGESLGVSEFDMDDAKRAGLIRDGSGWKKYPRNMLFARALSNGIRWYCPDVTHGVAVYHEGEIPVAPTTLSAASEEPDWGEDPELAAALQDRFERLGYTQAKVRTIMRGYRSDVQRQELLGELDGLLEGEPQDAEVVEESAA